MKKNYLTRKEAAAELGISPNQLKHQSSDRYKGKKPPRKKIWRNNFVWSSCCSKKLV